MSPSPPPLACVSCQAPRGFSAPRKEYDMKASRWLPAFALALCWAASAFGQTTGRLEGRITTEGTPLPGVTVTVTSPNLQGDRVQVTDERGEFRFPSLPPGTYQLRTALEGFNP